MSEQAEGKTFSYWVVEVDHQTGKARLDLDATEFWISRIFYPESNVMEFTPNDEGWEERKTIEINHDDLDTPYDYGRRVIDRAINLSKLKK